MSPPDIAAILAAYNIQIPTQLPGRYYTTCPWCSAQRKPHHRRLKVLGVTITETGVVFGCNHCHITGPMAGARDALPHYGYGESRKIRLNGEFKWEHLNGAAQWESGAAAQTTLYRIAEARECGGTVLVCEGEKDVDSLWNIGFAATCHPHGAGNWTADHSRQLAGLAVVVLNDNDEPGYRYANAVVRHTLGVARSVRRLDLKNYWPGIGAGEDVSDWLDHGGGSEDWLERILEELPEIPGTEPPEAPEILFPADIGVYDMEPIPELKWIIPELLPQGEVCLFSGSGAAGKSTIALDLCAAAVLGRDWNGTLPEPGPAMFIDAEDQLNVILGRLNASRCHLGSTFTELAKAGLHIYSLHCQETVLAAGSPRGGLLQLTPLYHELNRKAARLRPKLIVLSSSANFYAASEIDRSQVRQFITALTAIASAAGAALILIAHPSLTGMSNNSGISGSTAWHNSVRARWFIKGIQDDDDTADPRDAANLRLLEFQKNQYGPPQQSWTLHYRDGRFARDNSTQSDYQRAAIAAKAERLFTDLLGTLLAQGRNVSHKPAASNYAPKVFAGQQDAAGIGVKLMEQAMEHLFAKGTITVRRYGQPAKGWERIEPT